MLSTPKAPWAAGSSGPIRDDEAPTAFYRRRKRGAPQHVVPSPLPAPARPTPARHRSRPASSTPSPPTLLLPTGTTPEDTADGTILSPKKTTRASPSGTHPAVGGRIVVREFLRRGRERWTEVPSVSLTTAALILGGVVLLSAGFVIANRSANIPTGSPATVTSAELRGVCGRSSDMGRRLLRAQHRTDRDVHP